jgi:hypothetical protein
MSCCKNNWFLEQQISVKFCVKLGKNASDTCEMLSNAYGGEAMKKSHVFEGVVQRQLTCQITNEDNTHHFDIKGTVHFEFIPQGQTVNQAYYVEILKQLH